MSEQSNLDEVIDLKRSYPQSIRYVFLKSLPWLVITVLVTAFYIGAFLRMPSELKASPSVRFLAVGSTALFMTCIAVTFFKILYEYLELLCYDYKIELEHLVVSQGLFFKMRSSIPLAKIIDVHLFKGPRQMLFGLYELRIFTPGALDTVVRIEGLPDANAIGLQNHLLALVETTLPPVDEQAAGNVVNFPFHAKSAEPDSLHPPKHQAAH